MNNEGSSNQVPDKEPDKRNARLRMISSTMTGTSITQVCEEFHISRPTFYKWKKRYTASGMDGLSDTISVTRGNPRKLTGDIIDKVLLCCLENPGLGCCWLEYKLKEKGIRISDVSILKILTEAGLISRRNRWLKLEEKFRVEPDSLVDTQIAFVEACNPRFKERTKKLQRPGEVISVAMYSHPGFFKEAELLQIIALDEYSGYAETMFRTPAFFNVATTAHVLTTLKKGLEDNFPGLLSGDHSMKCNLYLSKDLFISVPESGNIPGSKIEINHIDTQDHPPDNGHIHAFARYCTTNFIQPSFSQNEDCDVDFLNQQSATWLGEYYATEFEGFPFYGQSVIDKLRPFYNPQTQ